MDKFINVESLEQYARTFKEWLFNELLTINTLGQILVITFAFLLARLATPPVKQWLEGTTGLGRHELRLRRVTKSAAQLTLPITWLILVWFSGLTADQAAWSHHLITIAVSLLAAWVLIHIATAFVSDPVWSKFISITAWTLAALNILDLLDPTLALLDGLAITLGDIRISALVVIKGVLSLAVLLWLATLASSIFERRIRAVRDLTPSVQVLFSKLLKIVLVTIAVVAALGIVGVDLTAFALFSGAIGVGIGFGLQKIVSNLISGVILLADKSIKPGDVVGLGETYGWINSLGARYASVITRDGTEHLIPNEDLITQKVVNWSYSDNKVRLKMPIGIAYESDVRMAIALCLEAAAETPRVLDKPQAGCLLKGFGDSSVDIELRIWIDDPSNGVANVKSEILLRVWDKFHAHGIQIPFPQRDLHIKSAPGLSHLPKAMPAAG